MSSNEPEERQGRTREVSWTGSEEDRREQGVCLPPVRPPIRISRYTIPAGTRCAISKVAVLRWCAHVTKRELGFERYEISEGRDWIFREEGYYIRVGRNAVRVRG